MKNFPEARIYDLAVEILEREMAKLEKKKDWIGVDYVGFEKLTKVYAILKDDTRDDIKAGTLEALQKVRS